jgi:hypothetical protein
MKMKTQLIRNFEMQQRHFRGKFIAMSVYIKKSETSNKQHNNAPQPLRKTRTKLIERKK